MLVALAFVSAHDIVRAFEELQDIVPQEIDALLDYFEDTWIGRSLDVDDEIHFFSHTHGLFIAVYRNICHAPKTPWRDDIVHYKQH